MRYIATLLFTTMYTTHHKIQNYLLFICPGEKGELNNKNAEIVKAKRAMTPVSKDHIVEYFLTYVDKTNETISILKD